METGQSKRVVLLRGAQLSSRVGADSTFYAVPPCDSTAPTRADGDGIYSVPTSAIQYCCGRGCKHCRIYWNRLNP